MRSKRGGLVLILLCSISLLAKTDVEKLEKNLASASGKERIKVLTQLASILSINSPKKALKYGEEAVAQARKLEDKKGEAEALYTLGSVYFAKGDYKKTIDLSKEALKIFEQTGIRKEAADSFDLLGLAYYKSSHFELALESFKEAISRYEALNDTEKTAKSQLHMGWAYQRLGNLEEASSIYKEAGERFELLGDKQGITAVLMAVATVHWELKEYEQASKEFDEALEKYEEIGAKNAVIESLNLVGTLFHALGRFTEALEYYQKSLSIAHEQGNKQYIATLLLNIGDLHNCLEQYEKALKYSYDALKVNEEIDRIVGIEYALNNIGDNYAKLGEYDKAIEYTSKALTTAKKIQDKFLMAVALNNLGLIYLEKNEPKEALEYQLQALDLHKHMNHKREKAFNLLSIGKSYLYLGDHKNSSRHLKEGLILANEAGSDDIIKGIYFSLSSLFSANKEYKKAFENYRLYTEAKDKILNQETQRKIADLEVKFETEKKEKEIALLKQDQKIKALELSKQRSMRNYLIGISGMILILALVILSRYRMKTRSERKMKETLEESHQRQAEVSGLFQIASAIMTCRQFQESAPVIYSSCKELIGSKHGFLTALSSNRKSYLIKHVDGNLPVGGLEEIGYGYDRTSVINHFDKKRKMDKKQVWPKNILFAPLVIEEKVEGLLCFADKKAGFSEDNARLASAAGELASIGLLNARMLGSLDRNQKALKKAHDELESKVMERTAELTEANRLLSQEVKERTLVQDELKRSLHEKEVMLKEIHHRVKNNMQIISSLLNLQSRQITDKQTVDVLDISQNRIKSMALIHEALYRSEDFAHVDFSEYVKKLGKHLIEMNQGEHRGIKLDVSVGKVSLDINKAIPIGLIINELMTNSFKHAFDGQKEKTISVELNATRKGIYRLEVSDNGKGLSEEIDVENPASLGLRLVKELTLQVNGSIHMERKQGTTFRITF